MIRRIKIRSTCSSVGGSGRSQRKTGALAGHSLAAVSARVAIGCAVWLGALACQGSPAPQVQGEPSASVAPGSAAAAAPAPAAEARTAPPAQARVGTTEPVRYEEPAADVPAAAGGQTVQGTVVTEEPFSVWLQAASPVASGAPASVEAVLVAKPPYHCNAEYPHKFKLGAAPAGLTYPETTVKGMRVTAERSVLAIPVVAQSPGKATVSGTLSFSVCTDERCLVEKRELSLNLDVK